MDLPINTELEQLARIAVSAYEKHNGVKYDSYLVEFNETEEGFSVTVNPSDPEFVVPMYDLCMEYFRLRYSYNGDVYYSIKCICADILNDIYPDVVDLIALEGAGYIDNLDIYDEDGTEVFDFTLTDKFKRL